MATQCKLQRKEFAQIIQPNTWTLLTFDTIIRNDMSMQKLMKTIAPMYNGDFIWARNISWSAIEVPDDDLRIRQFASRFIRDPSGDRDDTGTDDGVFSPGKNFSTVTWPFRGEMNVPVGVEVWHDHSLPASIYQAQFSATTWDY